MTGRKRAGKVEVFPVNGLGMVHAGDDIVDLVSRGLVADGVAFEDGDALVLTSKIVSKAEGRIVELATVEPTAEALVLARVSGRDPRFCELILRHTRRVWGLIATGKKAVEWARRLPDVFPVGEARVAELYARRPHVILAEVSNGLCLTDAGIDESNVEGDGRVILLPQDPDGSCRAIAATIKERTGKTAAVIVSDTELRTNRFGSIDQTIGSWGLRSVATHFGETDLSGRPKVGGIECVSDLIVAAAALVMGNVAEGVPAALVRGAAYEPVERGMLPIQEPPSSYQKAVLYNIGCRLKMLWYRIVG